MKHLAVMALLLLTSHALAAGPVGSETCPIPTRFVTSQQSFGPLKAAIGARKVDILAIGSGATTGAVGEADGTFPYRMLAALRTARPQVAFDLTVRGGRGMTAGQLLPLLREALKQGSPAVVLWQTGTVEAVHGMRPDRMRAALRAGLEVVRSAGSSLVLINPQYTRAFRANTDFEPYETELRRLAALPGASLFPRYDLTRSWVESRQIDPERAAEDARAAVLDRLNTCLGQALARYLLSGAE
jgi:acyl-CoA thioesterase I